MQQIYISIDDVVRRGIDNLAIEMPLGEWDKMNALLDAELPAKKTWDNFRNIFFWGVGIIIVALFLYQQLGMKQHKTATSSFTDRTQLNIIRPITTANESETKLQPEKNQPPKQFNKAIPLLKDTAETKAHAIVPPPENKTKHIIQKTSINSNTTGNYSSDEDQFKQHSDFFGVPRDSIIQDNVEKLKKKKRK